MTTWPLRQCLRYVSCPLRVRELAAVCSAENHASCHRERGIPWNPRTKLECDRNFTADSRRRTDSLTLWAVSENGTLVRHEPRAFPRFAAKSPHVIDK